MPDQGFMPNSNYDPKVSLEDRIARLRKYREMIQGPQGDIMALLANQGIRDQGGYSSLSPSPSPTPPATAMMDPNDPLAQAERLAGQRSGLEQPQGDVPRGLQFLKNLLLGGGR